LWIIDSSDDLVYKYNTDGTYTGTSFDTYASGVGNLIGITADDNFLWILDNGAFKVWKFNPDGTYTGTSFDLSYTDFDNPEGIVYNNGYLWIADSGNGTETVNAFTTAGVNTGFSFVISDNGDYATGITNANDFFYVTYDGISTVYKYEGGQLDATNPSVSSFSPTDGETSVNTDSDLDITFSETVIVGTGNITIKKSSDDSIFETIAIGSANVTGSGTNTIYIDVNNSFASGESYYVQIDATALDDENGNGYAGIADTTTWNFTIQNPSSSGSRPRVQNVIPVTTDLPVLILLPYPTFATECKTGDKFSILTGFPCPLEIQVPTENTIPPTFQFNKNLSLKMIDPDVKELQKYLNTHGFVITPTGLGSPGYETEKFGLFTYYALIKFQLAKSIVPPVGFFGPITRGVVNTNQ